MENRKLIYAFGEWLNEYIWNHFATFTFGKVQSVDTARYIFRCFMANLKKAANYFRVIEFEKNSVHIHSLLGKTDDIPASVIEDAWKKEHGIAQVLPYDANLGAAYYITKYVNSDKINWDFKLKNAVKVTCKQ